MYDEEHFTHDAATFMPDESASGITVDNGDVSFDWDDVERVHVDEVPWADHFESTEFFKIPGTVARPIPQPYTFGEDSITLMKPREELKQAAWSLDNAPWTLGHPDTGMVKSVQDIRGFWKNPRYVDSMDNLDADLMVPVGDEEARTFLEDHGDVSVGFYNKVTRIDQYDGVVGGSDTPDDLDGYQTDMYFDHVASVGVGRCPSGAGCGIHTDEADHGHAFISSSETTDKGREGESIDASKFVNPDGDWYAVPPADNPDDEWKFPINNCSDVEDAWQLRSHGDISISVETLEGRIKRRASDLGCEVPGTEESEDSAFYDNIRNDTMTDDDTQQTTDCGAGQFDFNIDDVTVDYLAAQHEGVKELQDELAEAQETVKEAEKAAAALDLDDDRSMADAIELRGERIENLQARVDEYEGEELDDLIEQITERTDRWDEDDLRELYDEEGLDAVEDRKELVIELTADETNANGGGGSEETEGSVPDRQTPWN